MGRWLNRIENRGLNTLTELTELGCVSSVSAYYDHFTENNVLAKDNSKSILKNFVETSCVGIKISPENVLNNLLSVDDEQDILGGLLTIAQLRGFIELWISSGAKHISGKFTIVNNSL